MKPTSPTLGDVARIALSKNIAALVEQPDDMEGVHQRRVATRRLRAALRVFRDALPPEADALRAELAWLGQALGAVRDLDVQLALIREAAAEMEAPDDVVQPIVELLEARRAEARQNLSQVLASPRYANLISGLRDLASAADWPEPSQVPALLAAPKLIRSRRARFRKAARRVRKKAPADVLHRARIRAKQLRYTLEFFAELYGKPARALIRRLTRVQDVLGTVQDAATLKAQLESMTDQLPPASVALLEQIYASRAARARKEVRRVIRRALGKRWKRLRRALAAKHVRDEQSASPPTGGQTTGQFSNT